MEAERLINMFFRSVPYWYVALTTSRNSKDCTRHRAKSLAKRFGWLYLPRGKKNLERICSVSIRKGCRILSILRDDGSFVLADLRPSYSSPWRWRFCPTNR